MGRMSQLCVNSYPGCSVWCWFGVIWMLEWCRHEA